MSVVQHAGVTKPVRGLSAGVTAAAFGQNLLRFSEDFSQTAWAKVNGGVGVIPTVTANFSATNPEGGTDGVQRIQYSLGAGSASSDISRTYQTMSGMTVGETIRHGVWLKSNSGSSVVMTFRDDIGSSVNTNITITTAWQYFEFSGTTGSAVPVAVPLWLRGGQGTGSTADILVWHPQYHQGSIALEYVKTGTTNISVAGS